jgi:hypothetical protein
MRQAIQFIENYNPTGGKKPGHIESVYVRYWAMVRGIPRCLELQMCAAKDVDKYFGGPVFQLHNLKTVAARVDNSHAVIQLGDTENLLRAPFVFACSFGVFDVHETGYHVLQVNANEKTQAIFEILADEPIVTGTVEDVTYAFGSELAIRRIAMANIPELESGQMVFRIAENKTWVIFRYEKYCVR